MDRFKAMEVFVAAAEAGSYAAASTKLFMTPQMVAKYVQTLETRLGVHLLTAPPGVRASLNSASATWSGASTSSQSPKKLSSCPGMRWKNRAERFGSALR